jgi:hypothetical protein
MNRTRSQSASPGVLALAATVAAFLALAPPAGAQDNESPDPFDVAAAAYDSAQTNEAKLQVVRDFLADYPEHPDVPTVVRVGARLLSDEMHDHAAAVALAERQLEQTRDPELVRSIQEILIDLFARPAYADRLEKLVGEIYDPAKMSFSEHLNVIQAAAGAEAWRLVDEHCAAAQPLANAETFVADYPDREFTAEYAAEAGRNREGLLDTFVGWSAANRGDTEFAVRMYKQAAKDLRHSFLGLPTNDLYRYWGETLVMAGEIDEGLRKLTLAAIWGNDETAAETARSVFAEDRAGQDFDAYLWRTRLESARSMVDFSAKDYDGDLHAYEDARGRKATLLAFWFPT